MSQELEELIDQAEWIERFVAGPDRLRWEELSPIGNPAPYFELQNSTGGATYDRLGRRDGEKTAESAC